MTAEPPHHFMDIKSRWRVLDRKGTVEGTVKGSVMLNIYAVICWLVYKLQTLAIYHYIPGGGLMLGPCQRLVSTELHILGE